MLVVDHTTDNNLVTFRFKHADVKMLAAEEDFELGGHKFRAGAFIIPNADRAKLEPTLKELGLSAWAVASAPTREDARPRRAAHRLRAQLDAHAGRRLGARRARHLRRALHLLRRSEAARGQPAREVRRDHLPARRRQRAVAGERDAEDRHRRRCRTRRPTTTPNLGVRRSERRHSRRHGRRGPAGAREVRAARAAR